MVEATRKPNKDEDPTQPESDHHQIPESGEQEEVYHQPVSNSHDIVIVNRVEEGGQVIVNQEMSPEPEYSMKDALPYLRWLRTSVIQNTLLSLIDPKLQNRPAANSRITIDQIYTPLMIRNPFAEDAGSLFQGNGSAMPAKDGSPVSVLETVNNNKKIVLLGDPGSGKSTFVNYLTLCMCGHYIETHDKRAPKTGPNLKTLSKRGWEKGAFFPVLVTLREFANDIPPDTAKGNAQLLWQHIRDRIKTQGLEGAENVIKAAKSEGWAVFLLDGLDEVPPRLRKIVREAVNQFMEQYPHNRYVVTCRILGYANKEWRLRGATSEKIAPFNQRQIKQFISAWYTALQAVGHITEELAEKRTKDLSERAVIHKHLREIATNPMLLSVMALVHSYTGNLPRETAKLYEESVKLLMTRWRPNATHDLLQKLEIHDENTIYRILWEIAFKAQSKQTSRKEAEDISESHVMKIAQKWLNGDWGKAQAFCTFVEEHAGLLLARGEGVGDDEGDTLFRFPHRTFQEYLAGCHIADNREGPKLLAKKAAAGANWSEAVILAAGHIVFVKRSRWTVLYAINEILANPASSDDELRAIKLAGEMLRMLDERDLKSDAQANQTIVRLQNGLLDIMRGQRLTMHDRFEIIETLSFIGRFTSYQPGVVNGLIDSFKDKAPIVRERAIACAATFNDKKTTQPLIEALADPCNIKLRPRIIHALGRTRDEEAVAPLCDVLRDSENKQEKVYAAMSLAEIGSPSAVDDLTKALRRDNPVDVRRYAARALGRIGDTAAVEPLEAAALRDSSPRVRIVCINALAIIGDRRAIPTLELLLDDEKHVNNHEPRKGRICDYASSALQQFDAAR